jgi:erythromycin esterase
VPPGPGAAGPPEPGGPFAHWLDRNAAPLAGVCADGPLEDLEPLGRAVRDARVVAVGESSHFVREFGQLRERVLRYLVQRLGFNLLAYEYGFSEGVRVDAWVRGEGAADGLAAFAPSALPVGLAAPLHWLRARNLAGRGPGYVLDPNSPSSAGLRFAGVDLPAAGGSLRPALEPVAGYLRAADPQALPWLQDALRLSEPFSAESGARAAAGWAALPAADQDTLTACLARLRLRLHAVEELCVERTGAFGYALARHRVDGACAADAMLRAMAGHLAGDSLPGDASVRERYMADSVLWQLRHGAPGTRIVLVAHNAHIQRTPVGSDGGRGGELSALPMGLHLARVLGAGYYALGLTAVAGETARMDLDAEARFGFTLAPTPLAEPAADSVERAFADVQCASAEYERGPLYADLRGARRPAVAGAAAVAGAPGRIRMQEAYLETEVLEAFDGLVCVPECSVFADEADTYADPADGGDPAGGGRAAPARTQAS